MRRTAPFHGFSRGLPMNGVPILGQAPEGPPAGLYYYQVAVLVLRDGQALTADSVELRFPEPLEGRRFKTLPAAIATHLQKQAPELAEPKIVVLSPFFLGFVAQEVIDQVAAQGNGAGQATDGQEEKQC